MHKQLTGAREFTQKQKPLREGDGFKCKPDDHCWFALEQLMSLKGVNIFVEQIANNFHAACLACSRSAIKARRRTSTGGGLRSCSALTRSLHSSHSCM